MFSTDSEKISFLLAAEAELADFLVEGELSTEAKEHPKYITNYIGSKQKLIDWIWASTPEGAKSVIDAFNGSAVVGYMYKSKGLSVTANDRLRYSWHIARAIIENSGTTISDEEIDNLLAANPNAGGFVQQNFKGLYFANGVHRVIDDIRANIDSLKGYKKDIALFALGKSCITGKSGFGHFGTTVHHDDREDSPERFKQRFADNCRKTNALVFDNEKECKAHNSDILEVLPQVEADLAYFDPPYATQFSQTNYERAYHFIEGLMTNWEGKEIKADSKTHIYKIENKGVTKSNANQFFTDFLSAAKHIRHWIISYRDQAYPSEPEMKKIIAGVGKSSRMKSRDHQYSISAKRGEASSAKEHLFICQPAEKTAATAEDVMAVAADDNYSPELMLTGTCDLDLLGALAAPTDKVKVTSYMGNKYFMLDFIWKHSPQGAESVLDSFSGGANTAYFFKQKGLAVTANDKLKYPNTIARAIIENSSDTLSDDDIELLLKANAKAKNFIADTFNGYFYTRQILEFLDNTWWNAQTLQGYKRDLALFALGYTCVTKARFGEFTRTKKSMRGRPEDESKQDTSLGNIPLPDFKQAFVKNLHKANSLVFDNGKKCQALNIDVLEAIGKSEADFIYADPPYITQFGSNDYGAKLHFVEGLMTYWEGKELRDNARKDFASETKYNRESMRELFGDMIARAKSPILISYRDKAYPTEEEVKQMLRRRYEKVAVKGVDVEYGIAKWASEDGGKHARELLFIGGGSLKAAACFERNISTKITGTLEVEQLSAEAGESSDKRFRFILTHVGANRNGDFFSPEELQQAAQTAVGKKIDLSHSQQFRDIVGGIAEAWFIEDGDKSRVEGLGELFTGESEPARLAYKLTKRGIVSHVSMECDYQEGECSVCGKRVKSKADYCVHLKNYKGRQFKGKPVYEILHGITFTGMGLLDREGADSGAQIKKVANNLQGDRDMPEDKKKGQDDEFTDDTDDTGDKDETIRKLKAENSKLMKELEAAQKRIEELEASQQAAARNARAAKLLAEWEQCGRSFENEQAKTAELERLAGLSDEAFSATEEVVKTLAKPVSPDEKKVEAEETPESTDEKPAGSMASDAGVKPLAVDDKKATLTDKLGSGLMSAYEDTLPGSGA